MAIYNIKPNNVVSEYYKHMAARDLENNASGLFIESVKQGNTDLSKILLPYTNSKHEDPILLLYKGRYLSQIDKVDEFTALFHKNKGLLEKSLFKYEGILPWIWRMGINKFKKNDVKRSKYYFDMHKGIAVISKHELAHYFQCFGAVLIMNGEIDKGNEYLSEALHLYFNEFERKEEHYSVIDNIRCIIMNLLLQAIMDIQVDDQDIAYKKLTFCKLWFLKTQITMYASGISELVTLVNRKYPDVIRYVFFEKISK